MHRRTKSIIAFSSGCLAALSLLLWLIGAAGPVDDASTWWRWLRAMTLPATMLSLTILMFVIALYDAYQPQLFKM